jgi:hypothetical protein
MDVVAKLGGKLISKLMNGCDEGIVQQGIGSV